MKISKVLNKKKSVYEYQARFQLGGKEFRPRALTRKDLLEAVDEIRARQHRTRFELPVEKSTATLQQLVDAHSPRIAKPHQRKIFDRTAKLLLSLLPEDVKIIELKKAHFQKYIDLRRSQFGKQTKKPVLDETIDKELYSISSALRAASLYFAELEDYRKPEIPKAHKGKKRRRSRVVNKDSELYILLAELRKPKSGKQTTVHERQRRRLADDLEFRFETGLRRKEVSRLKKKQYFPKEKCLRKVIRWKTGTETPFFPLTDRAIEIIENQISKTDSEYIFTPDGESQNADYKSLKNVCKKLGIPYGRYTENGFVPHDLRHNFASKLIEHTDIKTAQEFLGHSNIQQTSDYLHTSEDKMRAAVRKRQSVDIKRELVTIYKQVRRRKITAKKFVETLQKIADF